MFCPSLVVANDVSVVEFCKQHGLLFCFLAKLLGGVIKENLLDCVETVIEPVSCLIDMTKGPRADFFQNLKISFEPWLRFIVDWHRFAHRDRSVCNIIRLHLRLFVLLFPEDYVFKILDLVLVCVLNLFGLLLNWRGWFGVAPRAWGGENILAWGEFRGGETLELALGKRRGLGLIRALLNDALDIGAVLLKDFSEKLFEGEDHSGQIVLMLRNDPLNQGDVRNVLMFHEADLPSGEADS